jgi:tRNA(fMet)-specific endonuclease VapC
VKFLLDTDHISLIQWQSGSGLSTLVARMSRSSRRDFAYSVVSFHEHILGANATINRVGSSSAAVVGYERLSRLLNFYRAGTVLPFDAGAAVEFDRLRSSRVRIATMDLRIASIALSRGLILLTRNAADFRNVPGLVIQDWTL